MLFGEIPEQHDEHLKCTIQTLQENDVLLNREKSQFKTQETKFLEYELFSIGIKPLKEYINGIKEFRKPKSVEEVQSFLGLVNFVGKWIINLSTITDPLRKSLKLKIGKKIVTLISFGLRNKRNRKKENFVKKYHFRVLKPG